ncbi:MAG: hypothetical protein HKN87_03090 [Saprospiraceae bacterium]|nr:hypothetical protein [Saprospiraceae bacterium]
MNEKDELLIWQYVDGTLSTDKTVFVSGMISSNQTWSDYYQACLGVHNELEQLNWEKPSNDFADRVMQQVMVTKRYERPVDAKSLMGRVYLGAQALILFIILYGMRSSFQFSSGSKIGDRLYQQTISIIDHPVFQLLFIVSLGVFVLMLLDRILQKHYRGKSVMPV